MATIKGCEKHRGSPLLGACPDCKQQELEDASQEMQAKADYHLDGLTGAGFTRAQALTILSVMEAYT